MMTKRIGMSTTYRRVAGPLVAVLLAAGAVTGTGRPKRLGQPPDRDGMMGPALPMRGRRSSWTSRMIRATRSRLWRATGQLVRRTRGFWCGAM